ncbi:ABC-2 type transport system ATP-binding protein [Pseudoalteromonas ulvae UL12]|uniref:ABC transporter ATP-binding protein n=1 Tax=Pseudoalteromonas ulvae TaxID=107327 RepID=A0A244CKU9_PSEDV|nr:ATP-binding cassette domain-containing protein [Pseudoalteromonas ulvae]MBE0362014.1 ABC-2 type transport system ATP-binding protein [Pseudoalteromonas ulvae UL12]OUL55997.1 ABC transporter ATP-binding protein [Pseudoalteromonas ulvae]
MQISVEGVVKSYAHVKAVKGMSFIVNEGEIFALLGPNGAGKSSLVRMLVGFTHADEGRIAVHLNDQEYGAIPNDELGYLPEDRGLYAEKTVSQNLLYFAALHGLDKSTAKERMDYWLERFELLDRKDQPLKSLSKGNQQKVQLVNAVLHQPKIVILDEPFSGLDPINQEKVVVFLAELKQQGMTVILSAHQMSMVEKLADRMLLMNHGEVVLYGSLNDIQQQIGVGAQLLVEFEELPKVETIAMALQNFEFSFNEHHLLEVNLASASQVNEALTQLLTLGHITKLESKKMDLHQLYLKAISDHQGAPDYVAA